MDRERIRAFDEKGEKDMAKKEKLRSYNDLLQKLSTEELAKKTTSGMVRKKEEISKAAPLLLNNVTQVHIRKEPLPTRTQEQNVSPAFRKPNSQQPSQTRKEICKTPQTKKPQQAAQEKPFNRTTNMKQKPVFEEESMKTPVKPTWNNGNLSKSEIARSTKAAKPKQMVNVSARKVTPTNLSASFCTPNISKKGPPLAAVRASQANVELRSQVSNASIEKRHQSRTPSVSNVPSMRASRIMKQPSPPSKQHQEQPKLSPKPSEVTKKNKQPLTSLMQQQVTEESYHSKTDLIRSKIGQLKQRVQGQLSEDPLPPKKAALAAQHTPSGPQRSFSVAYSSALERLDRLFKTKTYDYKNSAMFQLSINSKQTKVKENFAIEFRYYWQLKYGFACFKAHSENFALKKKAMRRILIISRNWFKSPLKNAFEAVRREVFLKTQFSHGHSNQSHIPSSAKTTAAKSKHKKHSPSASHIKNKDRESYFEEVHSSSKKRPGIVSQRTNHINSINGDDETPPSHFSFSLRRLLSDDSKTC